MDVVRRLEAPVGSVEVGAGALGAGGGRRTALHAELGLRRERGVAAGAGGGQRATALEAEPGAIGELGPASTALRHVSSPVPSRQR